MEYMDNNFTQGTARQRYSKLKQHREHFLDRAEECSELTIPSLIQPDGFTDSSDLYNPFQSVGARGVNNLASKLLLLLLPPNSPFFRLSIAGKAKEDLQQRAELKSEVEKSLATIEREVTNKIEQLALRVSVFEALKHLIVAGNVLTYLPKKGSMRVFPLTQYVCQRDSSGNVCEIIVQEKMSVMALDKDVAAQVMTDPNYKKDEEVELYTHVYKLPNDEFYVCQEANGVKIPSSIGTFKKDRLPYQALRMIRVDNEDYGRGYVEEFLGDLKSLEGLSQSLVESAAASSKVVFLVRPNAVTRKKDLSLSRNGDIITGTAEDVSVLQAQKQFDLQVVERMIQKLEERLSFAFLLHTAIQRQAERVTATEVQLIANELNDALGGVYGILTTEFQLPYINTKLSMLREQKLLPNLPKELVKTKIIVGMEALGRASDRLRLLQFMADLSNTLGAETLGRYINLGDAIKKFAVANGIDTAGLIKSEEQIQQEAQAQQQASFQQALQDPRVLTKAGETLSNAGATVNQNGELEIPQEE